MVYLKVVAGGSWRKAEGERFICTADSVSADCDKNHNFKGIKGHHFLKYAVNDLHVVFDFISPYLLFPSLFLCFFVDYECNKIWKDAEYARTIPAQRGLAFKNVPLLPDEAQQKLSKMSPDKDGCKIYIYVRERGSDTRFKEGADAESQLVAEERG